MKFKVGQLVLLTANIVSDKNRGTGVKAGAVGEIKDGKEFSNELLVGSSAVDFPNNKSVSRSGLWGVPDSCLIPINDPDADTTEETEKNLDKELVK